MTKKAVVLLSGGLDSATTAAIAKADGYDVCALSFDYSQRHKVELGSAKKVAESLGITKHLVMKFDMREIGGSALTSDLDVPKKSDSPIHPFTDSPIPLTYVPARNTIFLSFALSWAEALEAPDIFIGANALDYSGYPDCRPEYLEAFEKMANLATKVSVEGKISFKINSPLLYLTKAEIIKKGMDLGLDYSLTWSCYDPQPLSKAATGDRLQVTGDIHAGHSSRVTRDGYVPCGRCDSCLFRAKGFKEAGFKDPLLFK